MVELALDGIWMKFEFDAVLITVLQFKTDVGSRLERCEELIGRG